jgi:hypothetical protein
VRRYEIFLTPHVRSRLARLREEERRQFLRAMRSELGSPGSVTATHFAVPGAMRQYIDVYLVDFWPPGSYEAKSHDPGSGYLVFDFNPVLGHFP